MTKTMSAKDLYEAKLINIHQYAVLQWEERLQSWANKKIEPMRSEVSYFENTNTQRRSCEL